MEEVWYVWCRGGPWHGDTITVWPGMTEFRMPGGGRYVLHRTRIRNDFVGEWQL